MNILEVLREAREAKEASITKKLAVHDELVAALRGMDEAYCDVTPHMTYAQRMNGRKALIACRAALSKASA